MVDPVSVGLSLVIISLTKNAPEWFHALKETLFSKGKELALAKGKEQVTGFLDEKKHLRSTSIVRLNQAKNNMLSQCCGNLSSIRFFLLNSVYRLL